MNNIYEKACEAKEYISSKINFRLETAIILGSGLGDFVQNIQNPIEILYKDIPGFPLSTVQGHGNKLVAGAINGKNVIAMQGRFHFYEGYSMAEVTFPIRVFKLLEIKNLIIVSAVGGVNDQLLAGDIVNVRDYIKLSSLSPLYGANISEFGERFPNIDFSNDKIEGIEEMFSNSGAKYNEAVYAFMAGPQYETKAEVKMLNILGADVVGMSTVPEIIVAKHCNMRVCILAVVTNASNDNQKIIHEEVVKVANETNKKVANLMLQIIKKM